MAEILSFLGGMAFTAALALSICIPGFVRTYLDAVAALDRAGVEPRP